MQYPEAPTFDGRPDLKAFIDWVYEIDHFFECYKLSDERKVQFAKLKLIDRAKLFWHGRIQYLKMNSRSSFSAL